MGTYRLCYRPRDVTLEMQRLLPLYLRDDVDACTGIEDAGVCIDVHADTRVLLDQGRRRARAAAQTGSELEICGQPYARADLQL